MIRPMHQADLTQVHHIEQQVQTHPWSIKQFQQSLDSDSCTVLEIGKQIIGFCIFQTVLDEANLLLIAIDPQHQGQGHATALLQQSMQLLKNQPIQIFLEVRQSNQSAIALYEKLDFHQIDLRRNYYPTHSGEREHAVIMVKTCHDDFASLFKSL
jgi:ribosomal-protein-alanine N-acetyltransferase